MTVLRAWILAVLVVCALKSSLAAISRPQKAQQLLKYNFETKKFVLDFRCLVEISKLHGPIVVVSAVGDARIGKSTTLNLIHYFWDENSLKPFHEIFDTGDTKVPVTHGVWALIIPAKTPDDSNVILLDVEGLNLGDDAVTAHLSMFTVLVSSSVHIFTNDVVKNNVLDFLYFVSRLTEMIFPDERFDNFPHLGIIVRGALETPPGYTLDEYVQDVILGLENNDGMQEQRETIGKYFSKDKISANEIPYVQDITIFKDMRKFRNADFHKVILSLVKQFKKSPPKKSLKSDHLMDGESLAGFVKELFHAMNNNSWMDFNNAYLMFEGQICAEAYDKIVRPVLDKSASEIGANLEKTAAEFKLKCALQEEVDSARNELLAAKEKAAKIEGLKQKAAQEEKLREETETKMKIARENWENKMKGKDEQLIQEVEKRERLQKRNKRLEEETERKSQQISELQSQRAKDGGGGGSAEQFFGSLIGAGMATAAYWFSDQRLKQNVTLLPHSEYDSVCLSGVSWKWNKTAKQRFGLDGEGRGVIAQEVEKKYPFAVTKRSDGYKQVNYKLLALMIKTARGQRYCASFSLK